MLTVFSALVLMSVMFGNISAQIIESDSEQDFEKSSGKLLGLKLRPEISSMVVEIERKTGEEIYAEYVQQGEFVLGLNYLSEDGIPVLLVNPDLRHGNDKKLEAVITHELLHLRLRVNGYPSFLFSDTVNTAKGRAIDTEQDRLNDLVSLIEHQIFKADMEKFDLYQYVNLAGDTADFARKNKGKEDGQADAINYARAILEYPNAKDVEEVKKLYTANKWTRSLRDGAAIAEIIRATNINSPKEVDAVFTKCLSQLFPLPNSTYNYKLALDPNKKVGRRMIVSISRQAAVKRPKSKSN